MLYKIYTDETLLEDIFGKSVKIGLSKGKKTV
jgi:hypothetical protein